MNDMLFFSKEAANQMRVYQHSARCPVVLRAFLECNPRYWCFIPMPWEDASADNMRHFGHKHPSRAFRTTTNDTNQAQDPVIEDCLDLVPLPLTAYAFSYRQCQEQIRFFRDLLSLNTVELSCRSIDLYQFKILAVRKSCIIDDRYLHDRRILLLSLFVI